ncbi:MAG: TldD/PmbA family protein [Caulobacteraceae bacterium]|nr:TldD/PmbA family protein [Caulobacter sp.]
MDEDLLHDVVQAALRAGADAAEAVGAESRALSVTSRKGELEEVEREESRDLSLRVFVGARPASVSGSDLSPGARARLVERAVAMARLAPEDPYAGLLRAGELARAPFRELDLFDTAEPSPQALEARAAAADAAAWAQRGVTNTDGGSASWSASRWRLVTSQGFSGAQAASSFSVGATAIAGEGAGMERGGDGRSTRWEGDLPPPDAVGAEAGRRAAARVGARKISSRTAPVLFENRLALQLLSPFVGAVSGPAVARGVSFLKERLGQRVFPAAVTVAEEPWRPRGLGSAAFDDEGAPATPRDLVAEGVLTTWLLNAASARQLGLETTGHASRGGAGAAGVSPHNLTVRPGAHTPAELMAQAGEGLQVTSMFGPSLNSNTGDWSAGVSGVWWEGGEPAFPVTELTVAGNLVDIYARLVVASDLEIRGANNSPSLFVDGLAVAGA